jgi:hypothetical protein
MNDEEIQVMGCSLRGVKANGKSRNIDCLQMYQLTNHPNRNSVEELARFPEKHPESLSYQISGKHTLVQEYRIVSKDSLSVRWHFASID